MSQVIGEHVSAFKSEAENHAHDARVESHAASLTIITNHEGEMTKQYFVCWDDFLAGTGTIIKKSAAQLWRGSADQVEIHDIADAAPLMDGLASNQAILCGLFDKPHKELTTQKRLLNGTGAVLDDDGCSDGLDDELIYAARDRAHTSYPEGKPGVLGHDLDADPDRDPLTLADADRILSEVWPEWGEATRIWRPSVSALVIPPRRVTPPPPGGLHAYALVPDASLIPAIGEELFVRLWLAGYGYIAIGEAGQLLTRTIIDSSVYQPERIFFEATPPQPRLRGRVKFRKPETTILRGARFFNPVGIGDADRAEFNKRVAAAKAKKKPKAIPRQQAYVEKVIAEATARGVSVKRTTLWNAINKFEFASDFPIPLADGTVITPVDILNDPERWHGVRIPHPMQPSYGGSDNRIAVIYAKDGRIYSHAHGGVCYVLKSDEPKSGNGSGGNWEGETGRTEARAGGTPQPKDPPRGGLDLDNARTFVRHQGEDIRYVPQFKSWLVWDGVKWRPDDTREIERLAKKTVDAMLYAALEIKNQEKRERAIKAAIGCRARRKIMDMITLAESEKEVVITANELDANPDLLGVKNGVINLKTGEFIASRRDLYITKSCAVAYDSDAKCPEWRAFLKFFMNGDRDLIAYLARVVGYLLTGHVSEEKAFLLWGNGKNGKTTFRETIYRMLGDYSRTGKASMLTAEDRAGAPSPDVAKLKGARMLAINEMTEGARINEERFKYLTGNDTLNARDLFKPPFDFQPTHKTVITTNYKPKIKDTDEGIWRKIELIPFVVQISDEKKVENFREEKLMPELPGILNWALEGLADYRRNGLKPPEKVTSATRDYRNSEDIIAQWFEDCCERSHAKGVQTAASALLGSLKEWTLDPDDTPSSTRLGRWLENKDFQMSRTSKGRFWKGIKLKDEETEERKPGRDGFKDEEDYHHEEPF